MKRIFIGGERPHEAVDVTATLELSVSNSTLENVVNAANDMWVANEKDLAKVLKYAPMAQELWNGKVRAGLFLPVYVPGEHLFDDLCKGYPDATFLTPENNTPQVVVVPVERLRAPGDYKSFADADIKSDEWLWHGHSVLETGTNLKLEYLVNRIQAMQNYDFVRIIVLKDVVKTYSDSDTPEEYNGKTKLPEARHRYNQRGHKRFLRTLLLMSNIEDAKDPDDPELNAVIDRFVALKKTIRVEIIAL